MQDMILKDVAQGHLSPKKAYRSLYFQKRRVRRAHFIKIRIHIPGEKGTNRLLKVLLFFPVPLFIVRFALRFIKMDKMQNIPLDKADIIKLIHSKGIRIDVTSATQERIQIRTF
ncbi:MAG: hypothetical protein PHW40_00220 [Candidatus Izemoplasmatales bacterium]|nr:hypothetical protein [Candidatus Izemoplasmatales bacterium]